MNPQEGEEASRLAAVAKKRAERAHARADQAEVVAERHERLLSLSPGCERHQRLAAVFRKSAASHRSAARLQDSYARRMMKWTPANGSRPRFMTGVAQACEAGGAVLTLVDNGQNQLGVAASDEQSKVAHDLEYVLGEGPTWDAMTNRSSVVVVGSDMETLWPRYGPTLIPRGIFRVAAVPLLGAPDSCIGSLTVFNPPRLVDVGVLVEMAAALAQILILSPDADLELYGEAYCLDPLQQAAGMVAVQARCSIGNALALIRARAYAEGASTDVIAQQILLGALEFN